MNAPNRLTKAQRLRSELALLHARYDHGAASPAVYAVIKAIEVKLAWSQHHRHRIAEQAQEGAA
jgi:hypothetical protein